MKRALLLFAGLTLLLPVAGTADESAKPDPVDSRLLTGVFAPDPEGAWRTIKAESSTSDCIGDLVAPLCAVETELACFQRHDLDLCRTAFWPEDTVDFRFYTRPPTFFFSYRVVRTWLATPEDLEPKYKVRFSRELGDLMIDVILSKCWAEDGYCSTPKLPTTYTVRKINDVWKVVEVHMPPH